ncbi:DinB family protein [Occultella glacieicola]|nr:DinB family protein [Occultella glacieicola]
MTRNQAPTDPTTTDLLGWVQHTIEHLCGSTQGLTEAQVRTPVAPSGWTVAGLLGHVHDSTIFWLHHVLGGHPMTFEEDPWDNDPDLPLVALVDRLRQDTAAACAAVEHLGNDTAPLWWPDGAWGGYRQTTVRGVLLHLLNDNAAHTGQLDMAREHLDGGVWDHAVDGVRLPSRG